MENINCDDLRLKKNKVFEILSDHPFLISNPENVKKNIGIKDFFIKKISINFYFNLNYSRFT